MNTSLSSPALALGLIATAGLFMTACGAADLATALPAQTAATLVTATEPTTSTSTSTSFEDLPPLFEELNLTEEQQAQAEQIHADTKTQIRALLTPEQLEVWDAFLTDLDPDQGIDRAARRALRTQMNLTAAQKDQIRAIRADSREQFQAILTPEQQATLEDLKAERIRVFNG